MADIAKAAGERLLTNAADNATAAVEKATTLRGSHARRVATVALKAGGDSLRAEYALRLADPREALAAAGLAVAVLACDLVLLAAVAAKGTPRMRAVAGVTAAGHVALVAWSQHRRARQTVKVNAALEATR